MDWSAWQMPAAVLGLSLATLALASLVQRHQQEIARRRALVRAFAIRAQEIESALAELDAVPLPRALRAALWQGAAAAWEAVRRLHPAHPEADQRIERARSRAQTDGGATEGEVPACEDEGALARMSAALDRLAAHIPELPDAGVEAPAWRRTVLERRAELWSRHFIVEARRRFEAGDRQGAIGALRKLQRELARRGPDTPFVRALHAEAGERLQCLMQGRDPDACAADEASRQAA